MKNKRITPYFYVIISFVSVILIGAILLVLPISTKDRTGLNFIDALFMSVSATCVTGLSVIPNVGETLTIFSKIVMAILIEIGGLSFLTIAVFVLAIFGKKFGVSSRFLMKEALNQNTASGIIKLIKKIILIALIIQFIGWIINSILLCKYYDNIFEAIGLGLFHTISSFNNAGFDLFGNNSLINFSTDVLFNISTILLIILGGLGFIVIADIFSKRKRIIKISIHSKIVVLTTFILIFLGAILYKLMLTSNITWLEAFFTSVTTRTAGFTTIDFKKVFEQSYSSMNPAYLLTLILMFVGASPCSTGGGIKTTTLFIILISMFYLTRGKQPVAFKRKISTESIIKAFSLVVFGLIYVLFIIMIICWIEPIFSLTDVTFEVISAFGTVGVSMGITPLLNNVSKILIAITMFIGRLGPLTIVSVWNHNWMKQTKDEVEYLEEKIIVG